MNQINTLQGASYAALSATLYEFFITFSEEVDYIWTIPRRFTVIKILYLFSRYIALLAQIINAIVSGILHVRYPAPIDACRIWYFYQALITYTMLAVIDIILMIRVYAFYNRSRRIGIFLICLFMTKVSLGIMSSALTLPTQNFDSRCISNTMPSLVFYSFIVGELLVQLVILLLTIVKHYFVIREGWGRTPLVSLLSRDGSSVFTIILGVLVVTIFYACIHYNATDETAHIFFPAFIAMLSCAGCRMIINMQKMVVKARSSSARISYYDDELTQVLSSVWSR